MTKTKTPEKGITEIRAFSMPDLKTDTEGNVIEGHAAVFGQATSIGGWYNETIERGAFDKTDFTDVLFSVNHDLSKIPLARSRNNNANSTLQLQVDDQGLNTRATLDIEKNNEAQALYSAVSRGDINGMSFIFTVREDEWTGLDTDTPSRTIKDIAKVYEVSAVSFPAYDGTDICARSDDALDSAKKALENARAKGLESSENEQRNTNTLEFERLKAQILINF